MERGKKIKAVLAKLQAAGVKLGGARHGHIKKIKKLHGEDCYVEWGYVAGAVSAQIRRDKHAEYYSDIFDWIIEAREEGWSYQQIADALNDEGYVTIRGSEFRPMTVKRIVDYSNGVYESTTG